MKNKRIDWFVIWIVLLCVMLMATVSYGAYTSVKYFKSVAVAKKEENEISFSSNYLVRRNDNEAPLKLISASRGSTTSVAITICNYAQNTPDKAHGTDITYGMEIQLLDYNGEEFTGETITYQKQDGTTDTITKAELFSKMKVNSIIFDSDIINSDKLGVKTLTGGMPSQDVYTITCDDPDILSSLSIKMTATPATTSDLRGTKLSGRLKIVTTTSQTNWTGRITDEPGCDALNYELFGTTEETVVITWNKNYVEPSEWSLMELGINEYPSTNSITIAVGGPDKPSSYRLQFYRTSAIPANETSNDLSNYIRITKE